MDWEAEYNNRARVPEHGESIAGWIADAERYRAERAAHADLDIAYSSESERTKLDIFWPDGPRDQVPFAMFIHGGYWQALDRKAFSGLARGANENGVAVAIPSYDLCPDITIGGIIGQMCDAVAFLKAELKRPFAVSGHSAGGHLTAALMARDPSEAYQRGTPGIRHGLAISGLFELAPLVHTSLNAALRLDAQTADAVSPARWTPPEACELTAWVGGAESGEFLRQSRDMAAGWKSPTRRTRDHVAPGENHFTVIASLADAESALTRELVRLAQTALKEER